MIITRPILSEKSAQKMDKGLYVLSVSPRATKTEIKDQLKKLFKVEAVSVRIVNLPAKKVNFRRRPGQEVSRRRAYVQLKEKQVLPGFELPKEKSKKSASQSTAKTEEKS
jgi:large subunit ribosomal protein L23